MRMQLVCIIIVHLFTLVALLRGASARANSSLKPIAEGNAAAEKTAVAATPALALRATATSPALPPAGPLRR